MREHGISGGREASDMLRPGYFPAQTAGRGTLKCSASSAVRVSASAM